MPDALRDVNGLFLRLNLSFFILYWIGVLLLNLFPVLISNLLDTLEHCNLKVYLYCNPSTPPV